MTDRHPATTGLLRWFEYDHLPEHLQAVSRPVGELAQAMVDELPDGPELSAGLRKLLEAKDCLVRAALEAVQTRSAAPTAVKPPSCAFRTYRVGADEPGRWLECAAPDAPGHRLHYTADGEMFE